MSLRTGGRAAMCIAACALLAGCSIFSSSSPKPKMAELPPLKSSLAVKTLWNANVGTSGDYSLGPAVAANAVFAASRNGMVTKVDASSGRILWQVNTGATISGGVGAGEDLVVVGTIEGDVIALEAKSGEVR